MTSFLKTIRKLPRRFVRSLHSRSHRDYRWEKILLSLFTQKDLLFTRLGSFGERTRNEYLSSLSSGEFYSEIGARVSDVLRTVARAMSHYSERVVLSAASIVSPLLLAVEFSGGDLRMVLVRGFTIIDWTEVPENLLRDEKGARSFVRGFLRRNNALRVRVITNTPVDSSLIRRLSLPQVEKKYLDDVVLQELGDTLPLSMESLDIRWQVTEGDESTSVYAMSVPKRSADRSAAHLRKIGHEPFLMFGDLQVAARAAGRETCIVTTFGEGMANLILVQDSVPVASHTVRLVSHLSSEDLISTISDGLWQLIDYSAEQDILIENPSRLPVVPVGRPEGNVGFDWMVDLRTASGLRVLNPLVGVETPQGFSIQRYAVPLGLISCVQHFAKRGLTSPIREFDFTSPRHLRRRLPIKQGLAMSFLIALFGVAMVVDSNVSEVEAAAGRMDDRFKAMERQHTLRVGRVNRLADRTRLVQLDNGEFQDFLASLNTRSTARLDQTNAILDLSDRHDLSIPSIAPEGQIFVVAGSSSGFDPVYRYADDLRRSGLFENVLVQRLDRAPEFPGFGSGETINFQLEVSNSLEEDEEAGTEVEEALIPQLGQAGPVGN